MSSLSVSVLMIVLYQDSEHRFYCLVCVLWLVFFYCRPISGYYFREKIYGCQSCSLENYVRRSC